MKAHVYVTLKRTVLDAQGQTVAGALRRMDYKGVNDVRQGKYFLLTLDDALATDEAQIEVLAARTVERFGRIDILLNNAGALWWRNVLDTPARLPARPSTPLLLTVASGFPR